MSTIQFTKTVYFHGPYTLKKNRTYWVGSDIDMVQNWLLVHKVQLNSSMHIQFLSSYHQTKPDSHWPFHTRKYININPRLFNITLLHIPDEAPEQAPEQDSVKEHISVLEHSIAAGKVHVVWPKTGRKQPKISQKLAEKILLEKATVWISILYD